MISERDHSRQKAYEEQDSSAVQEPQGTCGKKLRVAWVSEGHRKGLGQACVPLLDGAGGSVLAVGLDTGSQTGRRGVIRSEVGEGRVLIGNA